MKVADGKDFWAGVMFIGFGLFFMLVAQNYPMGTALRMGPAYFPTVLGGLMGVLGLIIFVRSFFGKPRSPFAQVELRLSILIPALLLIIPMYYWSEWFHDWPEWARWIGGAITLSLFLAAWGKPSLFIMMISVAAFGYLIRPAGFAFAVFVLIMGTAWAGHEFKLKEALMLAVGCSIFSVWVFVHALGLSMNVWPYAWS
ncbi:MAG: tripartite tricarboxylate transporter TctB family protein [Burkholderiales bacterium]|nr:tripartite tricarboxylate transporter TctB family protein [Burkholderiales bacterium]